MKTLEERIIGRRFDELSRDEKDELGRAGYRAGIVKIAERSKNAETGTILELLYNRSNLRGSLAKYLAVRKGYHGLVYFHDPDEKPTDVILNAT